MYNEDYRQVNRLVNENIILKQLHCIYCIKKKPCYKLADSYDPLVKTWDRSYHVNKSPLAWEYLNVYTPLTKQELVSLYPLLYWEYCDIADYVEVPLYT